VLGSLVAVAFAANPKTAAKLEATTAAESSKLRGAVEKHLNNATSLHTTGSQGMPCQCSVFQQTWKRTTRTVPKCIFIDLGAADGNTLKDFVNGVYGPVQNCPSGGQWEATLVEANPRFDAALKQAEVTYPGMVHSKNSHAAYMCEAQTSFFLDTQNHDHNYWGSSMSSNHIDAQASGKVKVTVPTVNVLRLLYETTIPADYVILKMDIEGAEWDVLPCLAKANYANLVDRLMVETHPIEWGNAGTTAQQFQGALAALRSKGVQVPDQYHSQTL